MPTCIFSKSKKYYYYYYYRNIGFSLKIASNQIQINLLSKEKYEKDYPGNHHVNACQPWKITGNTLYVYLC